MSIHELAFAKQSAKGTPATAAAFRIPLTSGTVKPRRQIETLEETGTSRIRTQTGVLQVGVEGTFEFAARPAALGLLLYGVLGAKAVSGAGDPFTHTFTDAAEQPWFTLWRQLENLKYEKFVDCKFSQLALTSDNSQLGLRAAMTVMGLDPRHMAAATYATEVAAAEESGAPFMHYDGEGALSIEGTDIASIERILYTINNNNTFQQGDSVRGYDIAEGVLDITAEVRALIEDAAEYNRFHYGSATPADGAQASKDVIELASTFLDFLWTRVAAAPGPERSLRVASGNRVQIMSVEGYEPNTGSDPIKKTSTYRMLRPSSGAATTATLKNATASY
jgi:hypothetical protein